GVEPAVCGMVDVLVEDPVEALAHGRPGRRGIADDGGFDTVEVRRAIGRPGVAGQRAQHEHGAQCQQPQGSRRSVPHGSSSSFRPRRSARLPPNSAWSNPLPPTPGSTMGACHASDAPASLLTASPCCSGQQPEQLALTLVSAAWNAAVRVGYSLVLTAGPRRSDICPTPLLALTVSDHTNQDAAAVNPRIQWRDARYRVVPGSKQR